MYVKMPDMLSTERVESTSNSRAQHVLSLLVDEAKHSQKKRIDSHNDQYVQN